MRKTEIEAKQLEMQAQQQATADEENDGTQFQGRAKIPLPKLPTFDDQKDDIDAFLFRFENHAQLARWPEDRWPFFLASALKGTALSLYHSLASADDFSWKTLKEALLKKFQCTEEGFRERFRSVRPEVGESFSAFLLRCSHLFERWVSLSGIDNSFNGLKDLLLREQILQSVSRDLAVYLREHKIDNVQDMCQKAELYREAHPNKHLARKADPQVFSVNVAQGQPFSTQNWQSGGTGFRGPRGRRFPRNRDRGRGRGTYSYEQSFPHNDNQQSQNDNQQSGDMHDHRQRPVCSFCKKIGHVRARCYALMSNSSAQVHGNVAQAFVSKDSVENLTLEECTVNGFQGTCLRDTGCTTAGVAKKFVRTDQYTGEEQRCKSFGGRIEVFPLAVVSVDTPYFSGNVTCCVIDEPVADLILGNLPGVSTATAGAGGSFVPACVSTRAQTRQQDIQSKPLHDIPFISHDITPLKLAKLQKEDPSLSKCFQAVSSSSDPGAISYFVKDSILYRKFVQDSEVFQQIVVPQSLRGQVLKTAHDALMSGHFGVRRTLARIRSHFFWPQISKDVREYCRSCDVCQKTISKGRIPVAPLQTMPVISEPLSRIAVDIVGPFQPVSRNGFRYVLTIMDVATRFPEAIPLRHISSVSVFLFLTYQLIQLSLFHMFRSKGCVFVSRPDFACLD